MKKILWPTDFSETAHNAIAYAAKLAKATGCDLTLLNVQSIFDFTLAEITSKENIHAALALEQLETQSQEVTKAFKVSCYAEVETSSRQLSSVIRDKGKEHDLIVMGTNGPDDLYQFLGGSNTYNSIVRSETPLLLIPAGYTYSEIRSMVYAFDYLGERELPLSHLAQFIKATNCNLTVLQVLKGKYNKKLEDDLEELHSINKTSQDHDMTYEFATIRSADVAQGINTYISRSQPDVLALCSVHRNLIEQIFHKSIIKQISATSDYPVYVFHA